MCLKECFKITVTTEIALPSVRRPVKQDLDKTAKSRQAGLK